MILNQAFIACLSFTDSGTPLGVLSPGQVGEISRLLGIYRSRAAADPSALEAHNPHDPHYRSVTILTLFPYA